MDGRPAGRPGEAEVAPVPLGGKYSVLGEVGAGGIGIILKCRDGDIGRNVAVKVLHERYRNDPRMLERFVEEAQINGQLQHPGIVPVYEMGVAQRRFFFTMKLIKGRTLSELLKTRTDLRADRQYFVRVFLQVCQTIAYAHSRGVIHRDLKPANIMVGAFGEVLVVDWGLAKILPREGGDGGGEVGKASKDSVISIPGSQGRGSSSIVGSVIGTPPYMPPEQASGDIEHLDERSDVFSLGAILCEILTGRPPYDGEDSSQVLRLAAKADLEEARRRLDGCGSEPELVELARECLRPAPVLRPPNAGELAERVGRYLSNMEARAQQAQIVAAEERVKAAGARRAQRLTLGLAVSVLCLVVLLGGGYLWLQGERAAQVARATRGINEVLLEAARIRGQGPEPPAADLAQALALLQSTGTLLGIPGVPDDLRSRVSALADKLRQEESEALARAEQMARDERMGARLDEIAIPPDWELGLQGFETREALRKDNAFARAFEEYGIDLQRLGKEEVTRRIRRSALQVELTVALETWAMARQHLQQLAMARGGGSRADPRSWRYLIEIARDADDSLVRNNLRDSILAGRSDAGALKSLVETTDPATNPPMTIVLLARSCQRLGQIEMALALLRKAQRVHPGDFNLSLELGGMLEAKKPPLRSEAVRFYTAALAARPKSLVALLRLGAALEANGEGDEALGVFAEAIRLDPAQPDWHIHRRRILQTMMGDLEGAIAASQMALRLAPENAGEHRELARLYRATGKYAEAVESYRRALDLGGMTWVNWRALGDADRYDAACVAALASAREGNGAGSDNNQRGRYRVQALEWLQEELRFRRLALVGRSDETRSRIRSGLSDWLSDGNWRNLREEAELAGLPPAERQEWERFWARVRRIVDQLETPLKAPAPPRNESPPSGATVETLAVKSVELRTSAFRGEDARSTHGFTLWQVRTGDGSYALDPVYSVLRDDALTSIILPPGLLLSHTPYFWRAAHVGEDGRISAPGEETIFTTGDLGYEPRAIDLSPYCNRDLVADEPGVATDAIDYGEGFLVVDGFDGSRLDAPGVRGLPAGRTVGVHHLGDYAARNAIQFARGSRRALRIDVPPARYLAFRFLVAGGNGTSRIPLTVEHADGSRENREIPCDDWFEDIPPNPYGPLDDGLWPVRNGMDRLFAGAFRDVNDAALFEAIIPVRTDTDVVALILEPGQGFFEVEFTRFNLLAITAAALR